jgi:SAM-dependent methyltransferase
MHPTVYRTFVGLFEAHRVLGNEILEIGAGSDPSQSLLSWFAQHHQGVHCVGIDLAVRKPPLLDLPYELREMNANDLSPFGTGTVDAVICNATLEHDKAFWATLAEVRRVLRRGGLFFVGVPGYPKTRMRVQQYALRPLAGGRLSRVPGLTGLAERLRLSSLAVSPTLWYHATPRDYYRFSEDAVAEVFLEGMDCLEMTTVLRPVRIVAVGRRR